MIWQEASIAVDEQTLLPLRVFMTKTIQGVEEECMGGSNGQDVVDLLPFRHEKGRLHFLLGVADDVLVVRKDS